MENTLAIAKRLYLALSFISFIAVGILIVGMRIVYRSSFTAEQLDECSAMLIMLGINCVVTMSNSIYISAITAHEKFIALKGTQLAAIIMQPCLVVIATRIVPNAFVVTVAIVVTNLLCAIVQRQYACKRLHIEATYHGWDGKLAKGLLGFSVSIILVTFADQVFFKTGQLIVGYFYGADYVAVYAVGSQIFIAYMTIGTAVASVFLPQISNLYHRNHDMVAISQLFARVGRIACMVSFLTLCGFAIFGIDFVTLWAGEGFFEAYIVAVVIMIPFTVDIVQNLGLTVLQVMDRYYFRGIMYTSIAAVDIALSIVLVQHIGIVGAAIGTACSSFLGNGLLMNWYYAKRVKLDIKHFWLEIWHVARPLLMVAVVFGIMYWACPIPHGSWGTLCLFACGFAVVSLLALWRFGMNDYEKSLVLSIVRHRE